MKKASLIRVHVRLCGYLDRRLQVLCRWRRYGTLHSSQHPVSHLTYILEPLNRAFVTNVSSMHDPVELSIQTVEAIGIIVRILANFVVNSAIGVGQRAEETMRTAR